MCVCVCIVWLIMPSSSSKSSKRWFRFQIAAATAVACTSPSKACDFEIFSEHTAQCCCGDKTYNQSANSSNTPDQQRGGHRRSSGLDLRLTHFWELLQLVVRFVLRGQPSLFQPEDNIRPRTSANVANLRLVWYHLGFNTEPSFPSLWSFRFPNCQSIMAREKRQRQRGVLFQVHTAASAAAAAVDEPNGIHRVPTRSVDPSRVRSSH